MTYEKAFITQSRAGEIINKAGVVLAKAIA